MRTPTLTLASAMQKLSADIYCEDGIAAVAIMEAGTRLMELSKAGALTEERLQRMPLCGCAMWCCVDCVRDKENAAAINEWREVSK